MHVCEDEEGASGVAIEERGGGVLQTEVSAIHEDG